MSYSSLRKILEDIDDVRRIAQSFASFVDGSADPAALDGPYNGSLVVSIPGDKEDIAQKWLHDQGFVAAAAPSTDANQQQSIYNHEIFQITSRVIVKDNPRMSDRTTTVIFHAGG